MCRSVTLSLTVPMALIMSPAQAREASVSELRQQVAAQDARIAELEARIAEQARLLAQVLASKEPPRQEATDSRQPPADPPRSLAAPAQAVQQGTVSSLPKLVVSGDVRLREEFNFSDKDSRNRARTVFRARLRARYALSDRWSVGAGIATGDPDDPNSTDVTLSDFADDFTVSLDQAWLRYASGGLAVVAGKFLNPFTRTELVWDGDVNPQGLAATYALPLAPQAQLEARALYFVVDEAAGGNDSAMLGGQLAVAVPLGGEFRASLAAGYFRYRLGSIAGADAGDFRSNLIAGGRYLSRYRLVDAIASLNYSGLGESWPLAVTVDWVKNTGAVAGRDTGLSLELAAGRSTKPGDWKLAGSYAEVGVDAVFAAYSNDNLGIGTNYRMFAASLEHVLPHGLSLGATVYRYRPLQRGFARDNDPDDWLNRVRLNLLAQF